MLMLRDHGTLSVREVLRYAIGYADGGYPIVPAISRWIREMEPLFREEWTESAKVYLADGVPHPGSLLRNPLLAATYRRIVHEAEAAGGDRERQIEGAQKAFYEGFLAEAIDRYVAEAEVMDITGHRHRGFLRGEDLAAWRATAEEPLTLDYRGYTLCKAATWSQGAVLLQQLALLEAFDIRRMELLAAEHIHTVVECAKLALADREAWYGDPEFAPVPVPDLLSTGYAGARRRLVGERASLQMRPGSPGGKQPRLPRIPPGLAPAPGHWGEASLALLEGRARPAPRAAGDTCHIDVVDRHGNMVACTPSGGWLQSSPCLPGLGFCLNTRGQQFNMTAGHPNALHPGKRPRTTLSPSLALRWGEPYLAFGTPGGDQQDQWSLNFFIAHIDFGLNLQEAMDAPMFHTTHVPSSFYPHAAFPGQLRTEDRLNPGVVTELRQRGHDVQLQEGWSLGRLCAVGRDAERGLLKAGANPRLMQGYAVGR
jgi:gamma-glutamyltranspeptidase/glutathione hydrolase